MGKRITAFDFVVNERQPGTTVFRWLYDEVRSAILDGRLKRGVRLPSTRALATLYGVSRGTVITAFEQLHSEGYLQSRVGVGTSVNNQLPEDLLHARRSSDAGSPPKSSPPRLSQYARRLPPPPNVPPRVRAFRPATPALDAFPLALWSQVSSRRLRRATRDLLNDVDPRGYRPLREAVAGYLGIARGVRCSADQVIIVAGIQQGLDLTARLLLDGGDAVWLEDPCFFGVPAMFRALAAKIIPVPVDKCGIRVDEGLRLFKQAKLAYVTPAHQFPLGATMSAERRVSLLDWARRARALIFEDDYDSEYRYSGHPISALQSLDRRDTVVFAGSFSKLLFPSLRLGYLVVPPPLVDKFAAVRSVMDRHSAVLDQAIMSDFITEGHLGRHIRRMRELYAARLALLHESIERRLGGVLQIPRIEAGVHSVAWLREGLKADDVARSAARYHVEVIPVSRFALKNRVREGLLLGFGAIDAQELQRGVDGLARAVEESMPRTLHRKKLHRGPD